MKNKKYIRHWGRTVSERVGAMGSAKGMTAFSGACCGMGGPDVGVADGGSGGHPCPASLPLFSKKYAPPPPSAAADTCNGGGRWMPAETTAAAAAGVSGVGRRRSIMVALAWVFSGECWTGEAATEGGNAGTEGGNAGTGAAATTDGPDSAPTTSAGGAMVGRVRVGVGAKAAGRGGW